MLLETEAFKVKEFIIVLKWSSSVTDLLQKLRILLSLQDKVNLYYHHSTESHEVVKSTPNSGMQSSYLNLNFGKFCFLFLLISITNSQTNLEEERINVYLT